jgi:hypothetical protein
MRAMALCLGILRARHRRCTRWDDDVGHRIGLVADDGLVHRLAVIGSRTLMLLFLCKVVEA